MRLFQDKRGFSLLEMMIAVMVMTIGLAGVASMQTMALKGTFSANSNSSGSTIVQSWSEWLYGLMNNPNQTKEEDTVTKTWYRRNLFVLMKLDTNPNDTMDDYHPGANPPVPFTEYEMGSTIDEIVTFFNKPVTVVLPDSTSITLPFEKSQKPDETPEPFIAADLPPAAPAGSRLVMRIAANVPTINTVTVEISLPYTNAFTRNRGATLRFVVSSNM